MLRRPLSPALLWSCLCGGASSRPSPSTWPARTCVTSALRYNEIKGRVSKEWEAGFNHGEGDGGSAAELDHLSLQHFVTSLTPEQQEDLLVELQRVRALNAKKKAEEKLASWRWRSRFGRPASLQLPKADPTGTFCELPEEWLKSKAAENKKATKVTAAQLRHLAVHNALPFIGFGFLDNLIMIVAGDYIDVTIGTGLGISTMAAAALGNTVSDLAGIGSAWYVENIAIKIGIPVPELSQEQLEGMAARWSANAGRGAGVVIGCLIGMFPLLFLPNHDEDKKTQVDE